MTRQEVLERYRVGIVNYRIKTLRYSQDQALTALTQIEESERLTVEEIEEIIKSVSIGNHDDNSRLFIHSVLIKPLAQAIYQAQKRKKIC